MQLIRLFQPGKIGGMEVKNRIIMPAMGTRLSGPRGQVTEEMIRYYVERAKGGAGLIIPQFARVTPDAGPPNSLAIYDDELIPALRELVAAIHQHDAKIAIQLCHLGMIMMMVGSPEDTKIPVPSVFSWMKERGGFKELSAGEINQYVEAFAEAARRAKDAGFDAAEFHACHGCLINTFLSPALNCRSDEYGGSTENRTRFARQILARSRQKVGPDFPLIFRISGDDDHQRGIRVEEAAQHAVILEQAGADAVGVSASLEFWSPLSIPCYLYPAGVLTPLAATVKQSVNIPVITVGKIDAVLAERILEEGKADFIAMGRELLADPHLPNKAREGRLDDIRPCIYCNNCLSSSGRGRSRSCTVNPFLGRESEYPPEPVKSPKKVMVIGGGLAGMQTAAILAQRGHDVSLYERNDELGGQWKVVCAMKGKQDYVTFSDQLSKLLPQEGVKVFTETEVTKELVCELKPDAVVLATGAVPRTLNVPGAQAKNVVQANDIIMGREVAGNRTVVIGGRFIGMEVTIDLAKQGKDVVLVTKNELGENGANLEHRTYMTLLRRLIELRVPLYPNCSVIEITEKGVYVEHKGGLFLLEADTVIQAVGAKSQNSLTAEIKNAVPEFYQIGDCAGPEDAKTATDEAATVALQI